MAPQSFFDTDQIKDRARKDILYLLEAVSKDPTGPLPMALANLAMLQVRGKKNLVIEQSLAGPLGIFVKFSTLQEYGVDKVFFLENGNADTSQKNIVFIARGESAKHAQSIAGTFPTLLNPSA
jgi:hypothetical protein